MRVNDRPMWTKPTGLSSEIPTNRLLMKKPLRRFRKLHIKKEYNDRLGKFSHLEHTENILQGLVWCPNCQRPMVRYKNVSHGKKLWYTYICPGHADDPARCSFVSIREDELNEVLFTAIQSQIDIAADMEAVVKKLNAQPDYRRQRSDSTAKLEMARRTLKSVPILSMTACIRTMWNSL